MKKSLKDKVDNIIIKLKRFREMLLDHKDERKQPIISSFKKLIKQRSFMDLEEKWHFKVQVKKLNKDFERRWLKKKKKKKPMRKN